MLGNFKQYSFKSALAKFDLLSWPKVKFKEDFLNIFHFTLPFFQTLFKGWIKNKLKLTSYLYFIYFLSNSLVLIYTQFNETLWDHGIVSFSHNLLLYFFSTPSFSSPLFWNNFNPPLKDQTSPTAKNVRVILPSQTNFLTALSPSHST